MSFPSSPSNNQIAIVNNIRYVYSSTKGTWTKVASGSTSVDQYSRDTANSASSNTIVIQAVNTSQNTRITAVDTYATSSYSQANAATNSAQAAFNKANSANVLAQAAFDAANSASNFSFDQYARDTANSASSNTVVLQGVNLTQNTNITAVNNFASGAYNKANSADNLAQSSFDKANSANVLAQASFNTANTKLNLTGGTLSGDLTVTGNLFVSGNTTTYTSNNVVINDPIILLANNNTGNALDIGFVAHYIESDTLKHTGLIKDVSTNTWYLLDNYTPEIQGSNLLDPNDASLRISTLKANLISNSVFINGYDALAYTQASFNKANTAASDITIIQGVNTTQNTNITNVDTKAQAAYDKANTGTNVSLGGFAPNNVLTVNSAGYIANNTNLNYYTSNNTLVVTGNVVGGGVRTTSSTTPPANAIVGDFWYKTDNDVLYRYTSDGTSAYWLDISGSSFTGSQLQINMISPFLMMGA
jgi:hypothetical protein